MKCAFLFPGQGSQYVGMVDYLYSASSSVRNTFNQASDILGYDLVKLCKEGPEEKLKETKYAQPAIVTVSIGWQLLLKEENIEATVVSGHSLGEYTALIASGALSLQDGIRIVKKRGELMQNAYSPGNGGMAAVIGLNRQEINELCKKAGVHGLLEPANFNCPGQIVVSGDIRGIERGKEIAGEMGAKKYIPLKVSGPFHSSLMREVAQAFEEFLKDFVINKPDRKFVSNVTGDFVLDPETIRSCLVKQLYSPVLWEDSINLFTNNGYKIYVEVGPGRVLSGLIRKIDSNLSMMNVGNEKTLRKTIAFFKEAD